MAESIGSCRLSRRLYGSIEVCLEKLQIPLVESSLPLIGSQCGLKPPAKIPHDRRGFVHFGLNNLLDFLAMAEVRSGGMR